MWLRDHLKVGSQNGPNAIIGAPMIDKFVASAEAALADIPDGATIMIGGFGGAGMPVTDALVSMGLRAVGLDFSPGQLTLARRRHLAATWVRGDLAALPFADGSFAAVVSYYAIIHVPRDEREIILLR